MGFDFWSKIPNEVDMLSYIDKIFDIVKFESTKYELVKGDYVLKLLQ